MTNIILDFLFVAVFHWGLAGAAVATTISQMVGGIFPLVYFLLPNHSLLRLRRAPFDGRALLKTCANGSSELMTNLSASLVNMLYNFQLMRIAGEDGVAAYGVIMYTNFIFAAIFIGYSIGSAPLVGYHYGAENRHELQNLFRKSLLLIGLFGLVLTDLAKLLSGPLTALFVGYDAQLLDLSPAGFRLYSPLFPVQRVQHVRLRLLYRAEQRPGLSRHLLPAHAGIPGVRRADSPPPPGRGRGMAGHCGRRAAGPRDNRLLSAVQPLQISLRLSFFPFPGQKAPAPRFHAERGPF